MYWEEIVISDAITRRVNLEMELVFLISYFLGIRWERITLILLLLLLSTLCDQMLRHYGKTAWILDVDENFIYVLKNSKVSAFLCFPQKSWNKRKSQKSKIQKNPTNRIKNEENRRKTRKILKILKKIPVIPKILKNPKIPNNPRNSKKSQISPKVPNQNPKCWEYCGVERWYGYQGSDKSVIWRRILFNILSTGESDSDMRRDASQRQCPQYQWRQTYQILLTRRFASTTWTCW